MIYYTALLASILLNASSLILMKSFAVSNNAAGHAQPRIRRLLDVRLVISVICYGVAAVFWLMALIGVDLMVAYPSLAVTYVIVALLGPRLFGEEFHTHRWVGIGLIITGLVVMHI